MNEPASERIMMIKRHPTSAMHTMGGMRNDREAQRGWDADGNDLPAGHSRSARIEPLGPGAMGRVELDSTAIGDLSDLLFYAALACLPIDGTVAGVYMPFWTPISPWLFMAYAVVNWRLLPRTFRAFRLFFLLPVLLVVTSTFGWVTVAFHVFPVFTSFAGAVGALACLASLDIALAGKRLPWRPMVRVLIAVYWFAFVVGMLQWMAIHFELSQMRAFFARLMSRQYITVQSHWGGGRPQFLFAEPSYIGMHLFGVLLPLAWVIRGRERRLANRLYAVIVVFAGGAILMGAGVRIILDSIIALVFVILVATPWRRAGRAVLGCFELLVTIGLGGVAVVLNNRLSLIAENGFDGDGSFYARLWQTLGPVCGALRHPLRLLLGYGAGNLSDVTHQGAGTAVLVLERLHLPPSAPKHWYAQVTPLNMFTMSAYTSFLVEFGAVGVIALAVLVLAHVTRRNAWTRMTVCWFLLLIYLYVQFEGYAFYALPLFVWIMSRPRLLFPSGGSE